jgi:ribose/xylose/arabinose/galactoside ABC-type transport system permease subunit
VTRDLLRRLGPFFGLIGVFLFFLILVWTHTGRNSFATAGNLQTIALQTAIVGMTALGMTIVIISGGIDLSVGAMVALTSCVAAALLKQAGWSSVPAGVAGVATGALCGFVNGFLITRLNIVPFIVTLGMLLVLRGGAEGLARNKTINPDPSAIEALLPPGATLPPGVWMVAILAVGVALLLRYTRFGRHVVAIGSNESAARLCGVPIARTKILIYTMGGAFAGLAGLLQFARLAMGDPTAAPGLELDVIAAVVIGGGSLSGGEGSVVGSLMGALIMTTIRSGCAQMEWENYVTKIVAGAIIVAAVALDRLRHRRM